MRPTPAGGQQTILCESSCLKYKYAPANTHVHRSLWWVHTGTMIVATRAWKIGF
jgi:hypothetical protein